ncbi:hypothetical protein [Aquimarina macrocephali]|uniref:hypothetical protein n=1 Tax=Aquimarina macrocephali TaxID=666563 RepID=UPI000463C373|nr:hypothetical protein [Aquimarina macrocephali]
MKKQSFKSKKLILKKFEISKINGLNKIYGGVHLHPNNQMASGGGGGCHTESCESCQTEIGGGI